jgi:estrone sulfotransferase
MMSGFVAVVGALLVLQLVHLVAVMMWSDRQTTGLNYYGLSAPKRRRFKRLMRIHSLLLSPILTLIAATARSSFSRRCFTYKGVAGPAGACSADGFRRASEYSPRPDDVFVVTQMRSGTTLTQHLVLQILLRGEGDLAGEGIALNAVSPWLESNRTVDVSTAPLLGKDRRARLIKTHLPASLCPFSAGAKYIYVARHPASCFASCVDFVRNNLRGFAPDIDEFERWYRSNDWMWWNTWAVHVAGWWRRAECEDNVLFLRFEDMVSDLEAVCRRVAEFLEVAPLTEGELESVVRKCSFAYMRANADAFEMHPPHLLQAANPFFSSGKVDRFADIPMEVRQHINQWCRAECAANSIPIHQLYPDLAHERELRFIGVAHACEG